MRYLLDNGETIDMPKIVPARGRLTVSIDSEHDPRLRSATMSTQVICDRPIVAERSIYVERTDREGLRRAGAEPIHDRCDGRSAHDPGSIVHHADRDKRRHPDRGGTLDVLGRRGDPMVRRIECVRDAPAVVPMLLSRTARTTPGLTPPLIVKHRGVLRRVICGLGRDSRDIGRRRKERTPKRRSAAADVRYAKNGTPGVA
jgi:hypothetical protein